MTPYDDVYYDRRTVGLRHSVSAVVSLVSEFIQPRSILDVGCAEGAWLAEWRRCVPGCIVLGVDGDWVNRERLEIPPDAFQHIDLNGDLPELGSFDLVMNLEVAEHLDASRSGVFVKWLCERAPFIVFSAAVPGQGGTGHVNEQWPAYWMKLFETFGFARFDVLRRRLWDDSGINWWYRQNLFVYASQDLLSRDADLAARLRSSESSPERIIHPEMLQAKLEEAHPRNMPAKDLTGQALAALLRAVRRRMQPNRKP